MDIQAAATTRIESDAQGRLTIGAVSQLAWPPPDDFTDFIVELRRLKCKNLILIGPPPYPKVEGMITLGFGHYGGEVELVHAGTGETTKLFTVYDPALISSSRRRRQAQALAGFHESHISPIVLVGGTRVGGSRRTTVLERMGGNTGAWIVQVGVFSPLEGADQITQVTRAGHKLDPSYGGTILRIDLNDRDCSVTPTFRDYSW